MLFFKYMGQETDERTSEDRPVYVTKAAFARHLHIHPELFRRWLNKPEKEVS